MKEYSNTIVRPFSSSCNLGIEHIQNIVLDMAKLSERSVFTSIETYEKGTSIINYFHSHIFSEKLPAASISLSKIPTILLRNDNFP
jgi:hypothetical protein